MQFLGGLFTKFNRILIPRRLPSAIPPITVPAPATMTLNVGGALPVLLQPTLYPIGANAPNSGLRSAVELSVIDTVPPMKGIGTPILAEI